VKYEDVAKAHAKDLTVEGKIWCAIFKILLMKIKVLYIISHLPVIQNLSERHMPKHMECYRAITSRLSSAEIGFIICKLILNDNQKYKVI